MGYHTVSIDDIPSHPKHECDRRTLSAILELEHVGLSVYTVNPGEQVPQHYHLHETQEELFYVLDGEMKVETPATEYTVNSDEIFVVEPGNYHRAFNSETAEETLRVIAIGGPNVRDGKIHDEDEQTS
ncbi:cupin domain-containing protein [Natronosalvus halobius]|uniref:cupin domain-containing protein n=1 Tax=Natronosalvus halobius TaxID=2953746 RepID=UPI00209E518C|nr:cupin domain-containing protein [Natronosalvus halobius]USZ73688.1 cupin domain-containing protein [Natronosalvus halobius]